MDRAEQSPTIIDLVSIAIFSRIITLMFLFGCALLFMFFCNYIYNVVEEDVMFRFLGREEM